MPEYNAGEARLKIIPDASDFKTRLEAELKKVDAHLPITVTANLGQAKADIDRFREVQRRNNVAVGVDVALAEADAKMAAFRARQGRDINVKVDANGGGALRQIEQLNKEISKMGDTLGKGMKFALTWTGIGELPAATLAITNTIGALQQLAQAGLVIPGIIAGATASIGTLAVGLDGVVEAYQAASKAANQTGSEQAAHAREVTSAENAKRNAVVDEAQAERDRTRAVKDAKFALEDLNLQLRGGKISEQQAINNALRQRRDLQRDMMTGQIKDGLDLQQRLLGIAEADQSVAEASQRNIELQDKANEANAKGIAGSDQVVAANERVTRAQQATAQTSDALSQAIGKPYDAANDALGKLSPKTKEFVNTLVGMNSQFRDLGNDVGENLFDGLAASATTLINADLPNLRKGMGDIATAWNGTLKQLATTLGSDSSKGLLDRILGDTAKAQAEFTKAIDPLIHGIGVLSAAGADALPRLADDLGAIAERFNNFIGAADKDGSLSRWINDGITGFEKFGNTLINIGSAIGGITKAAGGGDGLLTMLERGSKKLAEFLNSTEGQNKLKTWFEEGRREIQEHIIPLLQALPGLFTGIVNVGTDIANVVVPPLKDIASYLSTHKQLVKDVLEAFVVWKGITFATGVLNQINQISNAIGTSGSKSGKGKKGKYSGGGGLLRKLGLAALALEALNIADDAMTPDDNGDGDPNNPTKQQSNAGANAIRSDAENGAGLGATFGPWGAGVGFFLGTAKGVYKQLQPGSESRQAAKDAHDHDGDIPALLGTLPKKGDGSNKPFLDPRDTTDQLTMQSMADSGDLGIKWVLAGNSDYVRIKRLAWLNQHQDQDGPAFKAPDDYDVPLPKTAPFDGGGGSFAAGGPTPAGRGNGPTGGFISELHSDEWVLPAHARKRLGDKALWALTNGRSFLDGGTVDEYGNPVTPGPLPGPVDPSAPIAPNPMGGTGLPSALGAFMSGLNTPLSNLTSMIPGIGGQQGGNGIGGAPSMLPGIWGLPGAMAQGDLGMQTWLGSTSNFLAKWAGDTFTGVAGALYSKGLLGFLGLENSILSPSNSWFQAGAQSLGIFDKLAPAFGWGTGTNGNLAVGSQVVGVGPNGETISLPTFGTSGAATGSGSGLVNPSSRASTLGSANVDYTPDFLLSKGIAPLYTRTTDDKGQSIAQIPQWATQLAGAFNLTASSHSDSTLHGGVAGKGDSTNTNAGWAFDFSGKPEDEQRFADFISSKLSGQTLQAIWQNPNTGAQLGIAGGQTLGRDQYYTTKGGAYADHTDHVHWATDVAPNLWDATGKSLVPGIPDMAGGARWWQGGAGAGLDGLPAGGGGRGALLNLALASRGGHGGTPQANKALARQMFTQFFPTSEWSAFDTLAMKESGYDNTAKNPSSTAYGIGQFLDSTWGDFGTKTSDPALQIAYMLRYIKGKYGTPTAAWAQYYNHPGGVGWYETGGHTPGSRSTPIPAILHGNEFVQRAAAVDKYGVPFMSALNEGRIDPKLLPHFLDGGLASALIPPRPQPGPIPDAQIKTRGATPIPSAPVTPLPPTMAPPAPLAPIPGTSSPAPDNPAPPGQPQEPRQNYPGLAQVAPAPTSLNHNLDAINTGISSGASAIGSIVSSAVSAAAAAGSFGAGAAGASGAIGSLAGGLFTEGGKVVEGIANVVSSSLVGSVPGHFGGSGGGDRAFGQTMIPQQSYPDPGISQRTYNLNGISDIGALMDRLELHDSLADQAALAHRR